MKWKYTYNFDEDFYLLPNAPMTDGEDRIVETKSYIITQTCDTFYLYTNLFFDEFEDLPKELKDYHAVLNIK